MCEKFASASSGLPTIDATVGILVVFQKCGKDIDRFAKMKKLSRDVVLNNAVDQYLNKHSFDQFADIRKEIRRRGITMEDITAEIKAYRNEQKLRNS